MWMIEGEWSGYVSRQCKVVHREYVPKSRDAGFVAWCQRTFSIRFGDGTTLRLSVKEVHKKALPLINGYGVLLRDCYYDGATSVDELVAKREARGFSN
jgi:hypothetical protein